MPYIPGYIVGQVNDLLLHGIQAEHLHRIVQVLGDDEEDHDDDHERRICLIFPNYAPAEPKKEEVRDSAFFTKRELKILSGSGDFSAIYDDALL